MHWFLSNWVIIVFYVVLIIALRCWTGLTILSGHTL